MKSKMMSIHRKDVKDYHNRIGTYIIRTKWGNRMKRKYVYIYTSKQNIEDIQVFGVNMSFISLSEVKNFLHFMSAEGTNEIYNFSLHEMK